MAKPQFSEAMDFSAVQDPFIWNAHRHQDLELASLTAGWASQFPGS